MSYLLKNLLAFILFLSFPALTDINKNPYELITSAKESIEDWISFINNVKNLSNDEASIDLVEWLIKNYESLGIDSKTIKNYIGNGNFVMQVDGIRNYLNKI